MKKRVTLAILLVWVTAVASAQLAGGRVGISDLGAERVGANFEVRFRAQVAPKAVRRDHTLVLMPVLRGERDKCPLMPLVVHGPGSRVARERREWVAGDTLRHENASYATNGQAVTITARVPFEEWMSTAHLVFEGVEWGCCTYVEIEDHTYGLAVTAEPLHLTPAVIVAGPSIAPEARPLPLPQPQPQNTSQSTPLPQPQTTPLPQNASVRTSLSVADSLSSTHSYLHHISAFNPEEPIADRDSAREESPAVYFRTGSYDIDPTYMDNARTLSKLTSAILTIQNAHDSRVGRIVVSGFASPEGSFDRNDRLAFERAVSVKRYLMESTGTADKEITVYNGSVDWRGLRNMVERADDLPEKQQILSILDHTPVWDSQRNVGRLGELMRVGSGSTYRYLLRNYFPYLRNGAFIEVYYENNL